MAGTPSMTSSRLRTCRAADASSDTLRPSRAPSSTNDVSSATASGWLSTTPLSLRSLATIAATWTKSRSCSWGESLIAPIAERQHARPVHAASWVRFVHPFRLRTPRRRPAAVRKLGPPIKAQAASEEGQKHGCTTHPTESRMPRGVDAALSREHFGASLPRRTFAFLLTEL